MTINNSEIGIKIRGYVSEIEGRLENYNIIKKLI